MGSQPINIHDVYKHIIIHEMGHAVGLYHEHQRVDRDNFVTENIRSAEGHLSDGTDYDIITSNASAYGTAFDYASIMLYDMDFDRDGKMLWTNDVSLSILDVITIAKMYNLWKIVRYQDHRSGDFDGDGKSDILFSWGDGTLHVALTRLVGSQYKPVYTGQPWITGYGHSNGIYQLGDFNGDGKSDVMFTEPFNNSIHVATSTGNGFSYRGKWINDNTFGSIRGGGQYRVGDFNGDRKDDILFFEPANASIHVAISNGSNFYGTGGGQWIGPNGFGTIMNGGLYTVGDFDGNGKDDLLYSAVRERAHYVTLSTGSSFGKSGSGLWYNAMADQDYFLMDPAVCNEVLAAADINNDGKDDLVVYAVPEIPGSHFRVALSKGTSFETSKELTLSFQVDFTGDEFFYGKFNGDNLVDVIVRYENNNSFKLVPNAQGKYFSAGNAYEFFRSFGDVSSYSFYL